MSAEQPAIKKKLRILHLEDDNLDAELVREVLATEGVDCSIVVVATRDEFRRALNRGEVDLVISDYKLPDFQGDEALRIVREKWPDLPFIFVSGSIGEERATAAVKNGATDYVMKERLRRLGLAIHRAIEEAEGLRLRREAEAKLADEREFLTDIFSSVQDGIVVLNDKLEVVRTNPTMERLFPQMVPLTGKSWSLFCENSDVPSASGNVCAARATLQTGKAAQGNHKFSTVQGETEFNIFASPLIERRTGNMTGVILYLRDVTREQLLHQQLIQSQKMECIGQLAGSVAHDFNNILQSIMASGEMLAISTPETDPRHVDVVEIRKAADRAAGLTRQLLMFSRKQAIALTVLDLNTLANNMGRMLNRLLPSGTTLDFDLAPGLAAVKCDPGNIEQVILNLVVNARDAMSKGGRIHLSTSCREVTEAGAAMKGLEWRAGSYVCLAVRDTGTGILPDVMDHLFEPFFTTKATGKGTGLGLPTVYGIVKQHGGWIDVATTVGVGTTFTVYLPVHHDSVVVEQGAAQSSAAVTGGTVLLVEDEPVIRKLMIRALGDAGYTVLAADSCKQARELFVKNGGVKILISDVVVGEENGFEFAVELQQRSPDLRVLLTSGYVDERVHWEDIQARGYRFLIKPFALPKLIQEVYEILA